MILRYKSIHIVLIQLLIIAFIYEVCPKKRKREINDTHNTNVDENNNTVSENSDSKVKQEKEIKDNDDHHEKPNRRFKVVDKFPEKDTLDLADVAFNGYESRRVIGGYEAPISFYPYIASLHKDGKYYCGASVIDEQWVLTTAHCIADALDNHRHNLRRYQLRAGSTFFDKYGYIARLQKVFIHDPGNNEYSYWKFDKDWALARLDRPLPIGRNIGVVNLPAEGLTVVAGDRMLVLGWGRNETGKRWTGQFNERLKFAPVAALRNRLCQFYYRWWRIRVTKTMMCAAWAKGGKDACNEDKGGPLVFKGVQVGIISYNASGCGVPEKPGIYIRTELLTFWALNLIAKNEAYSVKELRPKILEMRELEKQFRNMSRIINGTKHEIKTLLQRKSTEPIYILARRRLLEDGIDLYAGRTRATGFPTNDGALDEINLINLIHERIIAPHVDESEILLTTLALHELMKTNKARYILRGSAIDRIKIHDIVSR